MHVTGDATVTITHRYTPKDQLMIHTQLADIVIVAAGEEYYQFFKCIQWN